MKLALSFVGQKITKKIEMHCSVVHYSLLIFNTILNHNEWNILAVISVMAEFR